jgi:AcrR family transcriptional regulator
MAISTRREQILDQAAKLFADRGFRAVTMDDIGAAVGISGPGVYRHFPGKEALLGAALVGISERLLDGGLRASGLDELIVKHIDFALSQPHFIVLQDRELRNLGAPDLRQVKRLQRAYVELWVRELRALHSTLAEPAARASVHAVFGLLNSTPHNSRVSRAQLGPLLRDLALGAFSQVK